MRDYRYIGGELELFAAAENWKRYMADRLRPFIAGDVLEVGAGIGGTTRHLVNSSATSWTALEPDAGLVESLRASLATLDVRHEVCIGTADDVPPDRRFDTILYIDVLEHISDDAGEMKNAASRLNAGGRLVVLSPAHPWL
ncbi:MAG: class I SAM-dependent methyltransferase, partial [Planctomycetaceae bacterium]